MIDLQNIDRHYGEKIVLKNLSFTFPDKGAFALMGPSGSGKTTLLRLLAGLDRPDGGSITSTHHKVAVAFQEPRLFSWITCKENINIVLSKENTSSNQVLELLKAFELDEVADKHPSALSGGMQQRLSLARALAFGGDLVLLDEPFSALDADLKARIAPFIKKACKDSLLIFVTHDPCDAALLDATPLFLKEDFPTALVTKS